MILKDLIEKEEKLLRFEVERKFDIPFGEYIKLNQLLKEIGEITTNYFILIKEYDIKLQNDNLGDEKREKSLIEYNDKLLLSDIDLDEDKINYFIKNNNIQ